MHSFNSPLSKSISVDSLAQPPDTEKSGIVFDHSLRSSYEGTNPTKLVWFFAFSILVLLMGPSLVEAQWTPIEADDSRPSQAVGDPLHPASVWPPFRPVQFETPAPESASPDQPPDPVEDLPPLDLPSLEEFAEQPFLVPGPPPATLTAVESDLPSTLPSGYAVAPVGRLTPASVTRIDHDMIWSSGARRLTELFDIYVPNTQIVKHHFSFEHLTPRGLVSDLEDKYLFLVNGKIMNHQTITGAFSEIRDLPLLGDIHHVDFVRGPGSALYGPGAISGVASLVTHNAMTDVSFRQGGVDEFSALKIRHGRKFTDDSGVFLYFGVADYEGATYGDATLVFNSSFATPNSLPDVTAGNSTTVPGVFGDDRQSWRSRAKMKAHAQYTNGNFDFWMRYTQGGEKATPTRGEFALPPFGNRTPDFDYSGRDSFQFGYLQWTMFASNHWEISDIAVEILQHGALSCVGLFVSRYSY